MILGDRCQNFEARRLSEGLLISPGPTQEGAGKVRGPIPSHTHTPIKIIILHAHTYICEGTLQTKFDESMLLVKSFLRLVIGISRVKLIF